MLFMTSIISIHSDGNFPLQVWPIHRPLAQWHWSVLLLPMCANNPTQYSTMEASIPLEKSAAMPSADSIWWALRALSAYCEQHLEIPMRCSSSQIAPSRQLSQLPQKYGAETFFSLLLPSVEKFWCEKSMNDSYVPTKTYLVAHVLLAEITVITFTKSDYLVVYFLSNFAVVCDYVFSLEVAILYFCLFNQMQCCLCLRRLYSKLFRWDFFIGTTNPMRVRFGKIENVFAVGNQSYSYTTSPDDIMVCCTYTVLCTVQCTLYRQPEAVEREFMNLASLHRPNFFCLWNSRKESERARQREN